jgi:hypothetical protein
MPLRTRLAVGCAARDSDANVVWRGVTVPVAGSPVYFVRELTHPRCFRTDRAPRARYGDTVFPDVLLVQPYGQVSVVIRG